MICFDALLLNLAGYFITQQLGLTIFLDTCGTIFIAALGGYVPGIAVGFFTNVIKSFFDSQQMYFCTVNILVAVYAAYFARKGFFKSLSKVAMLILPLSLMTTAFALLIYNLLNSTSFIQTVSQIHLNFVTKFLGEFLDKGLSILVAFVLLKSMPKSVISEFKVLGRRQAPLSDEMQQAFVTKNYLSSSSLRTKMLAILMISSLFVSLSLSFISYLLFRESAMNDRIKTVDGMVTVILNELNPKHIREYMELGRSYDEYRDIENKLYALKNSNSYIQYIYVYKIEEDGCHVIFDLDSSTELGDKPGQVIQLDYTVENYKNDLIAGRPIPPFLSDDEYGILLTIYKPLYDENGKCQCYAIVDFSLEVLSEYMRSFTIKLAALFTGCFIFIFVVGLWFIENNIILPVNTMAYCARNFAYDNPDARRKHFDRIMSLKIHTGDEIENLYASLLRMTKNISIYLENLQIEKVRVENMKLQVFAMDELAHKDSLTGIKNKAAYNREIVWLNDRIA
ncbi:MAG: cache domain-containing protein, partial [Selenomonadaceae bacterium]|nr:cache domain-containing protein [Selenomonadaceae bacterium]